ncbi:MAG: GDP-mannose 4,6-dehydratase [Anaerolineales bacterium]|nr:GDP-mannose 4,6-dehydratase [Anaerolineales bacterium]
MANYLVTGTAGFIASRVVEFLIRDGHTVVGIDNMNDAYDVRMKEYRLEKLKELPGFTFHRLNVADRSILDPAAFGLSSFSFDAVINLAARAGVRASTEDPWVFVETNVTGTLNLLELCRHNNVRKFILASTSSIYGANPPYPTPEDAASDRPLQPYAASKKGAEALCHSYHYLFDIDVSVVRYFTVYGPAGRPDLAMFRFVQWISEGRPVRVNGDGEQSRGFTYLDDIARGTLQALKPLGFEIINLGGHETITINRLIKLTEELIGKEAIIEHGPFHPADMRNNWADVSRAGKLLGWEPQVDLHEGMKRLVDWYNAERSWAKEILTP